ncbi:hypothetical protein QR685DRAFT_522213 [Neurospora intermedia]|uniref:Transposase n=1 Tax=Neurospora intermedia TaxID=5142 RepID=A0ABR3DIJ5_NEUIN
MGQDDEHRDITVLWLRAKVKCPPCQVPSTNHHRQWKLRGFVLYRALCGQRSSA